MKLYIYHRVSLLTGMIVMFNTESFEGKRNRHRHGSEDDPEESKWRKLIKLFSRRITYFTLWWHKSWIVSEFLDGVRLPFLDQEQCVEGYCLDSSYNKLELPSPRTHVRVNLEVLDIIRVDDRKFSVELNMYFGVVWKEPRLKLPRPWKNGTARPEAK